MPEEKVQKFSGNITQYRSFIRSFDIKSNRLTKDREEFSYLEQCISFEPRDIELVLTWHQEIDKRKIVYHIRNT